MLNIGIIGITKVLEPHVKRIQKNKNVIVIGKASVGSSTQLNSFHFSIPEFNRVELIERADILLVDNSSLLPFELLYDIVKKGKHIFMTEYLNLSAEECGQLIKLAHESRSMVQVSNPYFYLPGIQWLNDNLSGPLFLDVLKHSTEKDFELNTFPLLLLLTKITGLNPKKVNAISFKSDEYESGFTNIRLEFGDASVANLSFGNQLPDNKFNIKVYSNNQFISMKFGKEVFLLNNKRIDLSGYLLVNEFDSFLDSIMFQNQGNGNLENYLSAKILVQSIDKKISKFTTS
jgi:hypothetical protein